jgi:hypothetical protein
MRHLQTVYQNFRINDADLQRVWWDKLRELRFDYARLAVRAYTDEERFSPTPSDILTRYREIEERQKGRMRELKDIFDFCHSCYPTNLWAEDDWEIFKAKIRSEKYSDAKFKAEMIRRAILSARHTGETTFADYVRGVSV